MATTVLRTRCPGPKVDSALESSSFLPASLSSNSASPSETPAQATQKLQSVIKGSPLDLPESVSSLTRLRPLQPKTSLVSSGRGLEASAPTKPQRTCRVKCCPLPQCRLRTHHQYRRLRPLTLDSKVVEDAERMSSLDTKDHEQKHQLDRLSPLTRLKGGSDALPALPLDDLDHPDFRKLFHYFFGYQYDKIIRLMLPPPVSKSQRLAIEKNKQSALASALSGPVYCLHYIACTHHQMVFRKDSRCPDKNTALLYGRVNALLRSKLNNYRNSDIEDVVLVIFTLVMFEMASGRIQSLMLHRKAVEHLVASQGGVHRMGRSMSFVLTLDRIFSMMLCVPPLYATISNQSPRKLTSIPPSYGGFLQNPFSKVLLGSHAFQYVDDVCRAIEIIEKEESWSFDPSGPPINPSSNIHYFFFLRECAANQFVVLNWSTAIDRTVSRCILLATKIVDYAVLQDNYIITIPIELANKVQEIVSSPDSPIDWENYDVILIWILFVLTCASIPWEGRPWAMNLLRQQLNRKYGGSSWPSEWEQLEMQNVRHFVWSSATFDKQFAKTCIEVPLFSPFSLAS